MSKYSTTAVITAFTVLAFSNAGFGRDDVHTSQLAPLSLSLADSTWDGKKVPEGQQCLKFGGHGQTPRIEVKGIPKETEALIFEYSDHNYRPNDHGGHGKIGYYLQGKNTYSITVPSIEGNSFDLPDGFFLVEKHRGKGWDKEGAYMPPCSGGNGHNYYVTVKAVSDMKKTSYRLLGESRLEMGVY